MRDKNVFDISQRQAKIVRTEFEKSHPPVLIVAPLSKKTRVMIVGFISMLLLLFIIGIGSIAGLLIKQPGIKVDMSITARTKPQLEFMNLDFDPAEFPKYSNFDLPTWDEDELLSGVFSERNIEVEVKIDKNGNVTSAKALNGHQFLREICQQAALKTTFFPPVMAEVTLIYKFAVKKQDFF